MDVIERLTERGIQPSAQRVAVAQYVLFTPDHPSADEVWARVRSHFPQVSRATVYNTLHLMAARGLLRELVLAEGRVVFDPNVDRHHHFIDDTSGAIFDIPWSEVKVSNVAALGRRGWEVHEYQVVMRGRRKSR